VALALHDVSNVLTIALALLKDAAPTLQGPGRTAVADAVERLRDAHRIARDALGAPRPEPRQRRLADVLESAVRGLDAHARERGATVTHQLFPELSAACVGEPDLLSRVVVNVLLNAIQHASPGDRVRIVGDSGQPGHALLSISDEGPGVPDEVRTQLFQRPISTRDGGAGIGLQGAAELCRAAGGTIRLVPSQRGAHFAISWPLGDAAVDEGLHGSPSIEPSLLGGPGGTGLSPAASTLRPPASATLQNMRLLLVEDDPAIAEMLRSALSTRGATVRVVSRRRDLEAALEDGVYGGVLLDLSPIADDVAGVLGQVVAKNPGARLLLISGSIEGLPVLSPDIAITWVQKPFELDDVVHALARPLVVPTADTG
jgi:CheY-like chemotaxis protein/two-component sensor histidine kinase